MKLDSAYYLIAREFDFASHEYPAFNSEHEGYAVIQEELEELWEEVKKSPRKRSADKLREEAVQVAAMALRFLVDLCEEEPEETKESLANDSVDTGYRFLQEEDE